MKKQSTRQDAVAPGVFMVGRRNPESILQCNTYLRSFERPGKEPAYWCVDPGSQIDYPDVRDHLLEHIGDLKALHMFSINHQDPDVVGNLICLTKVNHHLTGLVTEDVWRLVRHLKVKPRHLYFANKARENLIKLPSGHVVQVVPTPFCHFRGALAFYDPSTRALFSGDLFGGFNEPGRVQLFGTERDWPGIAQFHQIYMPSRVAVAYAIRQVRALRPRVKVIAPQHGFLLQGDFMESVLDRLEQLPVGLDLLPGELDEKYLRGYDAVLREVIFSAERHRGLHDVMLTLNQLADDHPLRKYLEIARDSVRLLREGIRALPLLVDVLGAGQAPSFRALLKSKALHGCTTHGLPIPQLGAGVDEVGEGGLAAF
jgi:serine/threonine-protein kinase